MIINRLYSRYYLKIHIKYSWGTLSVSYKVKFTLEWQNFQQKRMLGKFCFQQQTD